MASICISHNAYHSKASAAATTHKSRWLVQKGYVHISTPSTHPVTMSQPSDIPEHIKITPETMMPFLQDVVTQPEIAARVKGLRLEIYSIPKTGQELPKEAKDILSRLAEGKPVAQCLIDGSSPDSFILSIAVILVQLTNLSWLEIHINRASKPFRDVILALMTKNYLQQVKILHYSEQRRSDDTSGLEGGPMPPVSSIPSDRALEGTSIVNLRNYKSITSV